MIDDTNMFDVAGDSGLHADDAMALEALVETGFDAAPVAPSLRPRAERLSRVLGLLDVRGSAGDADGLVDATLARIKLADQRALRDAAIALSPNDEDAFEALVGSGYAPQSVPQPLRRRAERHRRLLDLLEPSRAETAQSGLIDRTLSRVQAAADSDESRFKIDSARLGGRRFRIADLMTIAALVLIAGAAIGPMVGAMREQSRRLACQAGLQAAGIGFASYAGDFDDLMPMASPSRAGNSWWSVGKPEQSNSANFFTLARTGYTKNGPCDLACPGNAKACRDKLIPGAMDWRSLDEVSYSYQNMFRGVGQPMRLSMQPLSRVIAVDGSPVVRRAVNRLWINPLANSMNHDQRGQNALHADGRVVFITSPVLQNGDNIWLPRLFEQAIAGRSKPTHADPIDGTEIPAGPDDEFVGP